VIVVRIELSPFGETRRRTALEELTIVNVGTLEGGRCRYEARLRAEVALLVDDREEGPVALAAAAMTVLLGGSNSSRAEARAEQGTGRATVPAAPSARL